MTKRRQASRRNSPQMPQAKYTNHHFKGLVKSTHFLNISRFEIHPDGILVPPHFHHFTWIQMNQWIVSDPTTIPTGIFKLWLYSVPHRSSGWSL